MRERLNRDELKILIPFFRKYVSRKEYDGQPSPEEYAAILLNLFRGSDRLLTKKDGLSEAIRISSVSADLYLRGISGVREVTT